MTASGNSDFKPEDFLKSRANRWELKVFDIYLIILILKN